MEFTISGKTLAMLSGGAIGSGILGNVIFAIRESNKARKLNQETEMTVRKLNKVLKRFDASVDSIANDLVDKIEIDDAVLNAAVERACNNAANDAARKAIDVVYSDLKSRVADAVEDAVNNSRTTIESEVKRTITRKVNTINITSLKDEIRRDVKRDLEAKLQSEVDNMASAYTSQMEQTANIMKAISNKMQVPVG